MCKNERNIQNMPEVIKGTGKGCDVHDWRCVQMNYYFKMREEREQVPCNYMHVYEQK